MANRVNLVLPAETAADIQARKPVHAVLPVGSFEQHGPHLPLVTDTVVAVAIAQELARAYSLFMLPPLTISCSHEHHAWPATVSISARTLAYTVDDVYDSLSRSGLASLTIVNGHGGNYILANLVQEGCAYGKNLALYPAKDDWKDARRSAGLTSTDHEDMHAGELETSILLHISPELVRTGYQSADWVAGDRRHLLTAGIQKYTDSGVIGRPSLASAEKGEELLHSLTRSFASVLGLLGGHATAT